MPCPEISLRLVGADEDSGVVRFEDFRTFCDKMAECLRRAEAVVTQQAGRIRYRIVQLGAGSAAMTPEAIRPKKGPDRRVEVVEFFKRTVAELQVGTSVDPRLTLDDLRDFRGLFAYLRKTKELWIGQSQVTSQYVANIDKILGDSVRSDGTVSGLLERLKVHNRNEFALFPPVLGAHAICSFPDGMFEQVRAGIKRNVTVSGTLFYHPDKPFPERVHVRELVIHPPDDELPKLGELRGLFAGSTKRRDRRGIRSSLPR